MENTIEISTISTFLTLFDSNDSIITPTVDPSEVDTRHQYASVNSLLFCALICSTIALGYIMKKKKFYYLPESGAAMLLGFFIGIVISVFASKEAELISFKPEIFFFILLPPIIFDSGYRLKRHTFFDNIFTILLYSVIGTFISTLIVGFGLYGLAQLKIVPLAANHPMESLIFGALISAVDPVASTAILSLPHLQIEPMLYSLLFGEAVLNDAIAIVLFKTFEGYSTAEVLSSDTITEIIFKFLGISIASIFIGCFFALLCSFTFKHSNLNKFPEYEFALVFLTAYASYTIAELLNLSGIFALFFCAIVLAHYNFHNISDVSKTTTTHAINSISYIAESFVFIYLGVTGGVSWLPSFHLTWSPILFVSTLLLCFIGRACHIFPFSFLANFRRTHKIGFNMQIFLWLSGLRGAIAFALSLNVPTKHRPQIVTTTLGIVFVTTLLIGGLTDSFLTWLEIRPNRTQKTVFKGGNLVRNVTGKFKKVFKKDLEDVEFNLLNNETDNSEVSESGTNLIENSDINEINIEPDDNNNNNREQQEGKTLSQQTELIDDNNNNNFNNSGLYNFWTRLDDKYFKAIFGEQNDDKNNDKNANVGS